MINEYDKGGLKMIDIHSFNASLKIKWVQSYLNTDNKGKWKSVFDLRLSEKAWREITVPRQPKKARYSST